MNAQNTSGCEAPDFLGSFAAAAPLPDGFGAYAPVLRRIDLVIPRSTPAPFAPE